MTSLKHSGKIYILKCSARVGMVSRSHHILLLLAFLWGTGTEQSRTNSQRALFKRVYPGLPTASASSFCHSSGTKTFESGKGAGEGGGALLLLPPTQVFGPPGSAYTPFPLLLPGVTLESWQPTDCRENDLEPSGVPSHPHQTGSVGPCAGRVLSRRKCD